MGLLQGFKHDIFISYAWPDNVDVNRDGRSWVTDFVERLQRTLNNELIEETRERGKKVDFFFDLNKIESGRDKDLQLKESVQNSAILVTFMSARYLASPNCMNEQKWFLESLDNNGTLQSLSDSDKLWPIFVVALSGAEFDKWPANLQAPIYSKFFHENCDDGNPRLCHPHIFTRHKDYPQLNEEMNKFERDIVKKLRTGLDAPPRPISQTKLNGQQILVLGTEDLDESMGQLDDQLSHAGAKVRRPAFAGYSDLIDNIDSEVEASDAVALLFGDFATTAHTTVLDRALDACEKSGRKVYSWTESIDELDAWVKKKKLKAYEELVQRAKLRDQISTIEALADKISDGFSEPEEPMEDIDQPLTIDLFIDADKGDQDTAEDIQRRFETPSVQKQLAKKQLVIDFTYQTAELSQKKHHKWLKDAQEQCHGIAIVNGKIDPLSLKAKVVQFRRTAAIRWRNRDKKVRVSVHNAPPPKPLGYSWTDVKVFDLNSSDYVERFIDFVGDLAEGQRKLEDQKPIGKTAR